METLHSAILTLIALKIVIIYATFYISLLFTNENSPTFYEIDGLLYTVYPWTNPFNLEGLQTTSVMVPDSLQNMCVTDVELTVEILLPDLKGAVQPYYQMLLTHNGVQVELSTQSFNPLFNSSAPIPSCCESFWCGNFPVTLGSFISAWESAAPVWSSYNFTCPFNYTTNPSSPVWQSTNLSAQQWRSYASGCQFTCIGANSSNPVQQCSAASINCQPGHISAGAQDPCCAQVWCNDSAVNWPSYKQTFGPKGGFWQSNNFQCATKGTWPDLSTIPWWITASPNWWKNDPSIDVQCNFTCQPSPGLPWTEQCSVDYTTCSTPTNNTSPPPANGCSSFPPVLNNAVPSTLCFHSSNVPGLKNFLSGSLSGEWDLSIQTNNTATSLGAFQSWQLSFNIANCYARTSSFVTSLVCPC